MNDRKLLMGHLFSLFCAIAWGTSYLVSKTLVDKISPVQLMMLRFVIAWLAIWIIYPKWHFHWREEGQFVVLSLVGSFRTIACFIPGSLKVSLWLAKRSQR